MRARIWRGRPCAEGEDGGQTACWLVEGRAVVRKENLIPVNREGQASKLGAGRHGLRARVERKVK